MEPTKTKLNWKAVILVAGTYMSLYIGSGFATGQESLQYYGAHGIVGIISTLIATLILVFIANACFKLGSEKGIVWQPDVFRYFAGKYIGRAFEWYAILILFFLYSMMISGGGATLEHLFGLPSWVGISILGALSILCVVLGLKRMMEVLGTLGPILAFAMVIIAICALFRSHDGILAGNQAVDGVVADKTILRASSNWLVSAINGAAGYTCTGLACLPLYAKFLKNKKERRAATIAGPVGLMLPVAIVALAMLANITIVNGVQVPMLALAEYLHPVLGTVVAIVIAFAIFTSITPMLYSFNAKFIPDDKSIKFKILVIITGLFASFGGTLLPFGRFVNILLPTIGYISLVMLAFIIVATIRGKGFIDRASMPAEDEVKAEKLACAANIE